MSEGTLEELERMTENTMVVMQDRECRNGEQRGVLGPDENGGPRCLPLNFTYVKTVRYCSSPQYLLAE